MVQKIAVIPRLMESCNRTWSINYLQFCCGINYFYTYTFDILTAQVLSAFLTVTDSTDAKTKVLECSRGYIGTDQSFQCEFCYSLSRSCQSSMTCMDVIPGSGSATLLPSSLAEGTYCYRATAIVDGSPAKMIQDTFSIHSCSNTGINTS